MTSKVRNLKIWSKAVDAVTIIWLIHFIMSLFTDLLNEKEYKYNGKNLDENGLYVELDGWKSHIFGVRKK